MEKTLLNTNNNRKVNYMNEAQLGLIIGMILGCPLGMIILFHILIKKQIIKEPKNEKGDYHDV